MRDDGELAGQLRGNRLTTVEVIFYLPDYPSLLQSFIWQTMDLAPRYPRIGKFLDSWRREVEAAIHSVRIAQAGRIFAGDWRTLEGEFRLN